MDTDICFEIPARVDCLDEILDFLRGQLTQVSCPEDIREIICIAAEELFVNVAHYAYNPSEGTVRVRFSISLEPRSMTLELSDTGREYNPLKRPNPDITLDADEREVGGLGIYMVKQSMDKVGYAYENGRNIITIHKFF